MTAGNTKDMLQRSEGKYKNTVVKNGHRYKRSALGRREDT
jgi:hypothetical protein